MSSPTLSLLQYLRITAAALRDDTSTDAELLSRYTQGRDETAFAALVVRHGPLVARVCRQILGDQQEVEDAFQATFLALSRKADKIRIRETLAGWLYHVARQSALNARKSVQARHRLQDQLQAMASPQASQGPGWDEDYSILHEELAGLTEKLRVPLILYYLESKTQVEVAQVLGVTERAVRKWLEHGKSILQKRLSERGVSVGAGVPATMLAASNARAATSLDLVRRTVGAALAFRQGTLSGGTAELAGQVLQSLPYGAGWVVKTCLALLISVGSLGAGAYVWRASTLPLRDANGPLLAQAKDETPPQRNKEKVSDDRQPPPEKSLSPSRERGDKEDINQARLDTYGDPLPPGALTRLGTTRFRPSGSVRLLEFTADGKGILTVGEAGSGKPVRLWDKDTGKLLRQFGDFPNFYRASIGANGRIVAGWQTARPVGPVKGEAADVLYLWDVATGKLLSQFKGRCSRRHYAISPCGKYLAIDLEGKVGVRDIATRKLLWEQNLDEAEYVEAVAFSHDSNSVAWYVVKHSKKGVKKTKKGNRLCDVRLWETQIGKLVRTWTGDSGRDGFFRINFSQDGNRLIAQRNDTQHQVVDLLDRITGKVMPLDKADGIVCSPTGSTVATYKHQEGTWLWDVATGQLLRHLPNFRPGWLGRPAFSADAKILAAAVCTTKIEGNVLLDVATGKELRQCQNSTQTWGTLAFSSDGKTLAGTEGGGAALNCWEVASGKKLSPPRDYHGWVHSVAFTRDGKSLVSVERNALRGVVRVWDSQSGQERSAFPPETEPGSPCVLETSHSSNGKILAAGRDDFSIPLNEIKYIDLWDAVSGRILQRLEKPLDDYGFSRLVFSPGGKYLAYVESLNGKDRKDNTLVWELANGKLLQQQFPGWGLEFSPDGKILATENNGGRGGGGLCCLWEVATGEKIGEVKVGYRPMALAFSPNGQALLLFNKYWSKQDRKVKIQIQLYPLCLDKQAGMGVGVCRTLLEIKEKDFRVIKFAFSPDGKMAAASTTIRNNQSTVYLWETATGEERGRFQGQSDEILSLSFSPDGRRLASGSRDTSILIWDITGRLDRRGQLQLVQLSAKQIEEYWADLAGADAMRAKRALWTLVAAGQPTVAFLTKQLRPAFRITEKALAQLVADLDNDAYAVRKKARRQLEELGEIAEPHLRRALKQQPSLELRLSVNRLLALIEQRRGKNGPLPSETLRMLRAIEVLEQIGSPEARKVLEVLSGGGPSASQTEEAKASLARLAQRTVQP